MPAPSTIEEFLALVSKSGVVEEKRLLAHIDRLRESRQLPGEPTKLAAQLIRDGVITHFQAEQLLQGKWRRFTIGKYRVLERLGAGGMGSVYLCEHTLMRRRVAVKVLPVTKPGDSSSLERFYREARAVAALDHPNIVRAYDIDQEDNLHFLVMEHVDGSSLQEIIKRAGPIDSLRSAHYIRQAALGLQHAHDTAGLVHRDIKPGNILVDRNGIVKILDMGLARFFHDEEDLLTKKYDENVLGTADYLAPEQAIDSHSVDIRADIYSLGGTFYFCLTGRTPFAEGSVAQKLIWHQTRQPKPIRSIRPDVPEGIVAIVERMMLKSVEDRFQTPQEIADALAPWTQTPIPPPPENEMPQLSPAATRSTSANEGGSSATTRSSSDPKLQATNPKKPWQVSPGSAATTNTTNSTGSTVATTSNRPVPPAPVTRGSPPTQPSAVVQPKSPETTAPARTVNPRPNLTLPTPTAPVPRQGENGEQNGLIKPAPTSSNPTPPLEVLETLPELISEDPADEDLNLEINASSRRREKKAKTETTQQRSFPWMWTGIIVLILACGIVGGVYFFGGEGKKGNSPNSAKQEIIRVNKDGGLRLHQALAKAVPGTKIILESDIQECNIVVNKPDIIIEGVEGKQITWKAPQGLANDPNIKLLLVQRAPGFQLRNVKLDGDNKTEALINLYGKCPGIQIEKVEFNNTQRFGILITNSEGTSESPISFHNLIFHLKSPQIAIHFTILAHSKNEVATNRYFRLSDLSFPAKDKQITATDPGHVDLVTISLPDNVKMEFVR